MYCPKCGEKKKVNSTLCLNCKFDFREILESDVPAINGSESVTKAKKTMRVPLTIILVVLVVGVLIALINSTVNTVDITLPAVWYEDYNDLELQELARKEKYKNIVRNVNGSVTITMSKSKHREKLDEMAKIVDDAFAGLIEAPETPYVKNIKQANNYTLVTIEVDSEEYEKEFFELTHLMVFMAASIYQNFTISPQPVAVIVQDTNTGKVLLNYEP